MPSRISPVGAYRRGGFETLPQGDVAGFRPIDATVSNKFAVGDVIDAPVK